MGVKSVSLSVIINVAFFVTKALNLMALSQNTVWQLCFPFPGFMSGQRACWTALCDVLGCSSSSEDILVCEDQVTSAELRIEPAPGSKARSWPLTLNFLLGTQGPLLKEEQTSLKWEVCSVGGKPKRTEHSSYLVGRDQASPSWLDSASCPPVF